MSQVLQSTLHPGNIELSRMCTSADGKNESPYSVETPYGFQLDLDFLKYVDDIEKGNTIRKVKIHKKAKQQKCNTLPRNFSVPDTRFSSAESLSFRKQGEKSLAPPFWQRTNGCKVSGIQKLFIRSPCNVDPALSECNKHDYRSVKTISDTRGRPRGNEKFQRWVRPPFLRAASMPTNFKELSLEEQHRNLSSFQQKLKCLDSDVLHKSGDVVAQQNSTTAEAKSRSKLIPTQLSQIQQPVNISQGKSKNVEEQVKNISELKKQILILQEKNKQLNIQIKNQQSNVQNMSYELQVKENGNINKMEHVSKGSQGHPAATIGSKGQVFCLIKSPTPELFMPNDNLERERISDLNYQNKFSSDFAVSENKNLDPIPHNELFQNFCAVGGDRMRDVATQVIEEELGLALGAHPKKLVIKELRTAASILEKQFEARSQEEKPDPQGAMLDDIRVSLYSETSQGDQSMHLEKTGEQDKSEIDVTLNQRRDVEATEPKLSEAKGKYIDRSDLRPFTRSVGCGDCTVNVTIATLKETRSFGVNTDCISVSHAKIMATVETSDKATDATVRVYSKAVETEHEPSLHCTHDIISVSHRGNEEVKQTGVRGDEIKTDSDNQSSNQTGYGMTENEKECSTSADSQHSECEKKLNCQQSESQEVTLDPFLQPESKLISTNPETEQCIKKIEKLLCKQQSFLEQNYPELAVNFKKLCSSIGSLSSQLINSFQPLSSSNTALNQSGGSSRQKECDMTLFQSSNLKSIMKKKDGNVKSRVPPAKKNLQFIGVNGGYESTSSEDSNSSESADSDTEKDCDNTANETQPMNNKAEMSKDTEGAEHGKTQSTRTNADVNVMQHVSKRSDLKLGLISACLKLKDHLNELEVTNDKALRQNLNAVQREWFRISSQKPATPETVQEFLRELQEMSPDLLHTVVNLADENQNTALHYSVSHSNFPIVRLLLDTGVCNVDHQNKAGYTATMLASLASAETAEELAVVRKLLHLGNVNVQATQAGQTALMLAVSHGRSDMVTALLSCGADINIQDDDGSTALMCACEHGNVEMAKLLLAQPRCNTALTDKDGNTALTIAQQAGQKDIVVLLNTHVDCGMS
ncbi:KN motif and ankyrin repeat domain-containing protein 1-like [Stegostoma tigrinum]|uniref:KN motif and ankyrin repeat domain-containing protein 1-like n=1 Tax=Stegostoma tigrinum TaxID=3053191 RepID=UPI00286FDADB|nr:KN motif and ankyrin repeat domain-containing protein 1-like [Stegostoma tigrinum]